MRPLTLWTCALVVLTSGLLSSCKPRRLEADNQLTAAASTTIDRPFQAEDFTILFPVDWQRPQESLVPLAKIIDEQTYRAIIAQTTTPSPKTFADPFNEQEVNPLPKSTSAIPISEWFVTGIHLLPCAVPDWLVPAKWTMEITVGNDPLLYFICRPRIRLAVQRLGKIGDKILFDDKSMHFVFSFFNPELVRKNDFADLLRIENGVGKRTENPNLTKEECARMVQNAYKQVQPVREKLLLAGTPGRPDGLGFLALVDRLRPEGSGRLRIPYGGAGTGSDPVAATQKYRDFLTSSLRKLAILDFATFTFNTSGMETSTTKTWVFGAIIRTAEGGFSKKELKFAVPSDAPDVAPLTTAGHVIASSGRVETFVDDRTAGSVDKDLDAMITKMPTAVANHVLFFGGLANHAFYVTSGNTRILRGVGNDYEAKFDVSTYKAINNMAHNNGSCVSCHLATPLRFGQGGEARVHKGDSIVSYAERVNPQTVFDAQNLNIGLSGFQLDKQDRVKGTWNLRQLGYWGRTPNIGDRLAVETQADMLFANKAIARSKDGTGSAQNPAP